MSEPVDLFFASIVLTALLSGFLAWYAWRRPPEPGVRAFALIALAESLLAVAEAIAMTSATQAQASFWFNVRFLFIAVVPVLWLVFALQYMGRSDWLSKRILVGLFTIPALTQAILWTNSLHHQWVRQEVTFAQTGGFWIADTAARQPGLWFLVYAFYTTLVMLAGVVILLVAAARKRKLYRGQALLLSLGALVSAGIGQIPTFALLPQLVFNPLVPGIGLGDLFFLAAVFGFRFLGRTPARDTEPRMTQLDASDKRSLASLVLVFLVFVTGVTAIAYVTYQDYARQFRAQEEHQLSAIAVMKIDELEDWRSERLDDANLFFQNANFSVRVKDFMTDPSSVEKRALLETWLVKVLASPQYHGLVLLDTDGQAVLTLPQDSGLPIEYSPSVALDTLQIGEVAFLDFHRHTETGPIHLALLVPLYDPDDVDQPLGVLVLVIDPYVYLYPYLQNWPLPSGSGETLLVRREGDEVVFLNPLRFAPDAALELHFPLTEAELPAVQAALGQSGVVDGQDYRGVEVLASIDAVPDTPWFLVAKMDTSEVYAPLRARQWQTLLFLALLITAGGAGLLVVWRQQQVHSFRTKLESLDALRASEEKFKKAFLITPDAMTITRLSDGCIISANQGFTQILGYTEAEILGQSAVALGIWDDLQDRRNIVASLQERGEVANYEARFRTKQGEIRYGLVSASVIELNGEPHILNTTRDITERKRVNQMVDARLRLVEYSLSHSLEELMKATLDEAEMLTGSVIGFYHFLDEDQITLSLQAWSTRTERDFCRAEGKGFHYPVEQAGVWVDCIREGSPVIHNDYASLPHKKGLPKGHADVQRELVVPVLRGNAVKAILGVGNKSQDYTRNDVEIVSELADLVWEITVRKQAEETLRDSETRFSTVFHSNPAAIAISHLDNGILADVNETWQELTGFTREEALGFSPLDLNLWADPAQRGVMVDAVRRQGKARTEMRLRRRTGEVRDLLMSAEPIELKGERYLLTMAQDITERKRAEEEAKSAGAFLEMVIDMSPVAMWISDPQGTLTRVNRSLCETINLGEDAIVGKYNVFHDANLEIQGVMPKVKAVFEEHVPTRFSIPWMAADAGSSGFGGARDLFIDVSMFPILNAQGELTNVVCQWIDISERKRAEDSLRESEQRYHTLAEISPVGIFRTDPQGKTTYVNPRWSQISGLSAGQALGYGWLAAVHPDDRQGLMDGWEKVVSERKPSRSEYRFLRPDGSIAWVMGQAVPETDVNGEFLGYVGTSTDITERKRVEDELRLKDELLHMTSAMAKIGGWEFDARTGEGTWTDEVARIHDLDPAKPTNVSLGISFYLPESRRKIEQAIQETIAEARPYDLELEMVSARGNHKWVRTMGLPILENSKVVKVQGIFQDVTERKQAEAALQASEETFHSIVRSSPMGIHIYQLEEDDRLVFIGYNPAADSLLGVNHSRFVGMTIEEAFPPLEQTEIPARYRQAAQEGITWSTQQIDYSDGIISGAFDVSVFQMSPGKAAVMFTEVTARKRAEAALQASEARYRHTLDDMLEGCQILSPDWRYIYINDVAEKQNRRAREELLGQNYADMWPGIQSTSLYAAIRHCMEEGQPQTLENEFHYPDGQTSWLDLRIYPVPEGVVILSIDITDRKQAEKAAQEYSARLEQDVDLRTRELREAQEKLVRQERLAVLGQLAGSVGHELRNPLGVISNAAYYLKLTQTDASERVREYLEIIETETRTAEKIIADLLDFARIKNLDRETVPSALLVEQTLEHYPVPAGVKVARRLGRSLPLVYVDVRQMVQVLGNLMTNACQAMDGEGSITIKAGRTGGMVALSVTDTGPGISPENMGKIFEPLFTTKMRGIGLGLAVSQRLAEANGGRLEVQSEAGKGCTFTLFLPVAKDAR